jgi:ABC-2 type transport system ATP-binding protein
VRHLLASISNKFSKHNLKAICQNLDLDPQALDLKISKYSKGMMQKLGLLATFLSNADLIILDEPMSGLDPKARIALKKELINYKKLKKTIFFSSHILADMDEICDRVCVIHEGVLRFEGTPKALKEQSKVDSLEQAFLHIVRNTNNATTTKAA